MFFKKEKNVFEILGIDENAPDKYQQAFNYFNSYNEDFYEDFAPEELWNKKSVFTRVLLPYDGKSDIYEYYLNSMKQYGSEQSKGKASKYNPSTLKAALEASVSLSLLDMKKYLENHFNLKFKKHYYMDFLIHMSALCIEKCFERYPDVKQFYVDEYKELYGDIEQERE